MMWLISSYLVLPYYNLCSVKVCLCLSVWRNTIVHHSDIVFVHGKCSCFGRDRIEKESNNSNYNLLSSLWLFVHGFPSTISINDGSNFVGFLQPFQLNRQCQKNLLFNLLCKYLNLSYPIVFYYLIMISNSFCIS